MNSINAFDQVRKAIEDIQFKLNDIQIAIDYDCMVYEGAQFLATEGQGFLEILRKVEKKYLKNEPNW